MFKGAKLTHAPCIGGPFDGRQVALNSGDDLHVREGETSYIYRKHRLRGEVSDLWFYALDTMPIDHALSYLLRHYHPNKAVAQNPAQNERFGGENG